MKHNFELTYLLYLPEMACPVAAGSGFLAQVVFPLAEQRASLSSHPAPSLLPPRSLPLVALFPQGCDSSYIFIKKTTKSSYRCQY